MVVAGTVFRLVLVVPFVQEQLQDQFAAQQLSATAYVARDIESSVVARRTLIGQLAGALPVALLVEVAARLLQGRRAVDTVARLGGDEFVILLADLAAPREGAAAVAAQCLSAIAAPYVVDDRILTLSVSIGVVWHRGQPISSSHLMSQADIAMYRAKRAGKNALCLFDDVDPQPDANAAA